MERERLITAGDISVLRDAARMLEAAARILRKQDRANIGLRTLSGIQADMRQARTNVNAVVARMETYTL